MTFDIESNRKTMQEWFDLVSVALLKQNRRSSDADICRYRVEILGVVLKCAVGHAIPDELYTPELEGWGVQALRGSACSAARAAYQVLSLLHPTDVPADNIARGISFWVAMQTVHDRVPVPDWAQELQRVARDFKLNSDVITAYK